MQSNHSTTLSFMYDDNDELQSISGPAGQEYLRLPDFSTAPNTFNVFSSQINRCVDTYDLHRDVSHLPEVHYNEFVQNKKAFDLAINITKTYDECNQCITSPCHLYDPQNDDITRGFSPSRQGSDVVENRSKAGLTITSLTDDADMANLRKKWADGVIDMTPHKEFLSPLDCTRLQLALIEKHGSAIASRNHDCNDYVSLANNDTSSRGAALRDLVRGYACVDPEMREQVVSERDAYCQGSDKSRENYMFAYRSNDSAKDADLDYDNSVPYNANKLLSGYDQTRDLFNNPLFKESLPLENLYQLHDNTLDFYVQKLDIMSMSLQTYGSDVFSSIDDCHTPGFYGYSDFTKDVQNSFNNIFTRGEDFIFPEVQSENSYHLADYYVSDLDDIKDSISELNFDCEFNRLPMCGFGIDVEPGFRFNYDFGNSAVVNSISSIDFPNSKPPQSYIDNLRINTQYFHPNQVVTKDIPTPPQPSDVGLTSFFKPIDTSRDFGF